jgi:O-antigen ligase
VANKKYKRMKYKLLSEKITVWGLLSTLLLFPLLINIALIPSSDPVHPLIQINFSPVDIIIAVCLLLWIINQLIYKNLPPVKLPPAPVLFFIGIGALSFVNAFSMLEWLKGIIQMIEYFFLFYMLLTTHLQTVKIATIKNMLFISTNILLAVAFIQHTFLAGEPYFVRGFFANRNILGSFLCMVIPLVYIELIYSNRKSQKIWMGALLLTAYFVLLSGSTLLSLFISLLIISWMYSRKVFIRFIISALLLFAIYPFIMPAKNVNALKEFASIYEQGSVNENYYRRLVQLDASGKNTLFSKTFGDKRLEINSDDLMSVKFPEIRPGEKYKDMDNKRHIKNRYIEMQASLNLLSENTLLGVGLGNFQNQIGTFYKELPKINTAEINQHNGYLIVASTMGILGLSALLWLFFLVWKQAKRRFKSPTKDKYIFLGLTGSILACMIESLFSDLFVASLLTPFIFIVYLTFKESPTNEIE